MPSGAGRVLTRRDATAAACRRAGGAFTQPGQVRREEGVDAGAVFEGEAGGAGDHREGLAFADLSGREEPHRGGHLRDQGFGDPDLAVHHGGGTSPRERELGPG